MCIRDSKDKSPINPGQAIEIVKRIKAIEKKKINNLIKKCVEEIINRTDNNLPFIKDEESQPGVYQSAWKGLGEDYRDYNCGLGLKHIAKVIKEVVKIKHPDVKISIKTARGRTIDMTVLSADRELLVDPNHPQGYCVSRSTEVLCPKGKELVELINNTTAFFNHDRSDGMTDYFDTGFYSSIGIGRYDKPFTVVN